MSLCKEKQNNHEPSGSCMLSMKLTAFAIHASISFLLCPGCNLMNDLRPSIAADVHSTYLQLYMGIYNKISSVTILYQLIWIVITILHVID